MNAEVIDRFIEKYSKAFENVANRLQAKIEQAVKDGVFTQEAYDSILIRDSLQTMIRDAGYDDVVAEMTGSGYNGLVRDAKAYMEDVVKGLQYSDQSIERLKAIQAIDIERYTALSTQQIDNLERIIIQSQFGSVGAGDLIEQLKNAVEGSIGKYATTYVDTFTSAFARQASNAIAVDGGIEWFIYAGPDDKITREFCQARLGEVRTMDEWSSMLNDFGQPVSIYCGGYNCRHQLLALSPDDKRIPN